VLTISRRRHYVGYRHFDRMQDGGLFPFGLGQSYTTFKHSALSVTKPTDDRGAFTVTFKVKNTRDVAGSEAEAAQVYVRDVESTLPQPIKELKGLAKLHLQAEQEQTVTIELDRDVLKYWDDRKAGCWLAEKGELEVLVGPSAVESPSEFALDSELIDLLKKAFNR
jgi:beta-glucosidase